MVVIWRGLRGLRGLLQLAHLLASKIFIGHILRFPNTFRGTVVVYKVLKGDLEIWPAIDLRGGNCVRLEQGDYDRETVFSGDPVAMARHWQDAGATNLHLVDLDGARDGSVTNRESIRDIVAATTMTCEVGGGIRTEETIRDLIDMGVQ